MANKFKQLYLSDSEEEEHNEEEHDFFQNEIFSTEDVEMLYNYFVYNLEKDIVKKHHVIASLRRHKGDIDSAGEDIKELLDKNLLPEDQEWQSNIKKNTILFYEDKVYRICDFGVTMNYIDCLLNPFFCLEKIMRFYDDSPCSLRIDFACQDLRFGKFKKIEEEELDIYINKEIEKNKIECLEEIYELEKKLDKFNSDVLTLNKIINDIRNECYNQCSSKMKKQALYDSTKLNCDTINIIEEYGIETDSCDHYLLYYMDNIEYLERDIDEVKRDIYFKKYEYNDICNQSKNCINEDVLV